MTEANLLQIQALKTYFHTSQGTAKAVDEVSFHIGKAETVGLVGESGCGKSVTALSIMRLIQQPPGHIVQGRIYFDGVDLLQLSQNRMRDIRGNRVSMIFQEPMTSLNPVYTIGNQISEMLLRHRKLTRKQSHDHAVGLLQKVQIPSPERRAHEYPHQLSGGMRQRVMIAMALACNPKLVIADEPTTALDVTIQAQIVDLLMQLKEDFDAAILMITHDLGIIAETTSRIIVMYAGQVVEENSTLSLFESPLHPYTRGLLRSVPILGGRTRHGRRRLREIPGVVPSLYALPPGCRFHPRCRDAEAVCSQQSPILTEIGDHKVRCWLYAAPSS